MDQVVPCEDYPDYPIGDYPVDQGDEEEAEEPMGKQCLSSMTLLFYYLAPLQNNNIVTSQCMQFIFGDKGEAMCLMRECPTCD